MKKQCPICGEYIDNDVEICPFCNERVVDEVEDIKDEETVQNEVVKEEESQEPKEKQSLNFNIQIVMFSIIFILVVLVCMYFLFKKLNSVSTNESLTSNNQEIEVQSKQLPSGMDDVRKYFQDKQYEKAAKICEDEINNSQNPIAFFYLGRIYQEQGYTDLAIENLKKAANSKPDLFEAQLELAKIYYEKNEYDSAVEYLNAANRIKNNNKEVLTMLVDIYYDQENVEKCIEFSKILIKIDPDNYHANIAMCVNALQKNDINSGIKYLKKSLDINFRVDDAIFLAKLYMQKEQYTNAINLLDKVINENYYNYEANELRERAITLREDYRQRQQYKQYQQSVQQDNLYDGNLFN